MKQDMIVILDLGSTENTTLARAIRDLEMCIRDSPVSARGFKGTLERHGSRRGRSGLLERRGRNASILNGPL